jgi:hypothetical protein
LIVQRRAFLIGLGALLGTPGFVRAAPARVTLAAAWQAGNRYQVGVLDQDAARGLQIAGAFDVPTRAHGLLRERGGTLLAVARRPGDWLVRWSRSGRAIAWQWVEPRRAFSGHVLASPDGRILYTTEMNLDTGAGLIGVRDAASLEKRAEWPTHGIDAHELVWDAMNDRCLIIANGGVPTQPETGRVKRNLERMDSSLVRLDVRDGKLLGQWRLDDPRLSLRHMAWYRDARVLGIALQAEHDDAAAKTRSPVLARFDGHSLRTVSAPVPLAGYGGDIAALEHTFAVSCPRAQGIALYGTDGAWHGFLPLAEACALAAASAAALWAGGHPAALTWSHDKWATRPAPDVRLDNHWIAI